MKFDICRGYSSSHIWRVWLICRSCINLFIINIIHTSAADDTLVCDWGIEQVKHITMHVATSDSEVIALEFIENLEKYFLHSTSVLLCSAGLNIPSNDRMCLYWMFGKSRDFQTWINMFIVQCLFLFNLVHLWLTQSGLYLPN